MKISCLMIFLLERLLRRKLSDYEKKLHLVEKFLSIKQDVEEIHSLTQKFHESKDEKVMEHIATISNQILEEL